MAKFLLYALLLAGSCSAASVTWLYPHENGPDFNVRDKVYLHWESDVKQPYMNLYCVNGKTGFWEPPYGNRPWSVASSGTYALQFKFADLYNSGCHLGFYTNSTGDSIGDSPDFYVTFNFKARAKVWGIKRAGAGQPSGAPGIPATKSHPPVSDTKTQVGVGVGVGVAIGVILAVVLAYVLRRRRRRKLLSDDSEAAKKTAELSEESAVPHPSELSDESSPSELMDEKKFLEEKKMMEVVTSPKELDGDKPELAELDGNTTWEVKEDAKEDAKEGAKEDVKEEAKEDTKSPRADQQDP